MHSCIGGRNHATSGWARQPKNPSDEFKLHIEAKKMLTITREKKAQWWPATQHNCRKKRKTNRIRAEKKQEQKKVKIRTHAIQFPRGIKLQPSPTILSTRTSSTYTHNKGKNMHIHTVLGFFVAFISDSWNIKHIWRHNRRRRKCAHSLLPKLKTKDKQ